VFHENWRSKDAFDQHLKTPHFEATVAKCRDLIASAPEIRLFAKIG
jgi:quinol monooxygenase YgiN